jgi:hypothetical protein
LRPVIAFQQPGANSDGWLGGGLSSIRPIFPGIFSRFRAVLGIVP